MSSLTARGALFLEGQAFMNLVLPAVLALSISFSVTFTVLNWITWRRQVRLNALLTDICLTAWKLRHVPIWAAWSQMTGVSLEIVPGRKRDDWP